MIQIKENKIIQLSLPSVGILDGRTVSNYDYLEKETLYSEGWYDEENIIPEYDATNQYPIVDYFEINGNNVKVFYKIQSII